MTLAFVHVPEGVEEARRLARLLSDPPRCGHYRWRLDPAGVRRWDRLCSPARGRKGPSRGRVPPCLCTSATDTHPDCPHVTWQSVVVVELPDGTVLLGVEDPDRHGETRMRGRPALSDALREEMEPAWSAREDRRSVLRPTDPAPPERGATR
jgi:hypothetical protein